MVLSNETSSAVAHQHVCEAHQPAVSLWIKKGRRGKGKEMGDDMEIIVHVPLGETLVAIKERQGEGRKG